MGSDFEPVVRTRRYFRESPSITGVNFQAGAGEENPSLICLKSDFKKVQKVRSHCRNENVKTRRH